MQQAVESPKLLSLKKVLEITSLSKTSIYRKIKNGQFPRPKRISEKRVAWLDTAVYDWSNSHADA